MCCREEKLRTVSEVRVVQPLVLLVSTKTDPTALMASLSSLQARADDVSEAILKRLDALEKENGKLRTEIKQIEAKTTAKAAPAKPAPEAGLSPEVARSKAGSTSSSSTDGASSSYMLQTAGAGYIASPDGAYFQKKPGDSAE
jgi:peptidoglycan hydrolase CwlO-like protein